MNSQLECSIPDQTGRRVVLTGGNSGIGFEAAKRLAAAGAEIILATRDRTKGEAAAEAIRSSTPRAVVQQRTLDVSSLPSVRRRGTFRIPALLISR